MTAITTLKSRQSTEIITPPDYGNFSVTQLHLMSLKSTGSRRTLTSIFNNIARLFGANDHLSFDWLSMKPADANVMIAVMMEKRELRPTTVNSYISALRALFNTAYLNGLIEHETCQRMLSIKNVKATRVTRNRKLIKKEVVSKLIEYCESLKNASGTRDAAIISTLASCGLRRAELASLTLHNYMPEERSICVIGKGNKERVVPVSSSTIERIERWIDFFRGNKEGYLFCRVRRHGFIGEEFTRPLSGNAIYDILKNRTSQLDSEQVRPHGLRRYCGTSLLNAGNDLVLVRDYLGHESIATTQIYTEKDQSQLHKAASIFD
tara:strand:+ start:345 stop:1310 length:966 start_codon:yes stop_codon:yes gene_type:complete